MGRGTIRIPAALAIGALAFAASLLSAASPWPGGSNASQAAGQAPQPPVFRAEANYVRVDAYPTRDGQVVPDLAAADFQVLEDGVPQRIDHCEFVQVRRRRQASPTDAVTVDEARQIAENPRARVFVVFLDTYHVGTGGSARMRRAMSVLLRGLLGPDDVMGIMTPHMPASDVTFTRRLEVLEAMLDREWIWGRRDQTAYREPEEVDYENCYPERSPGLKCVVGGRTVLQPEHYYRGVAREMILRRREQLTLDALGDLVGWLRGVREERKAVIAISDGWRLFEPNDLLARRGACELPPGTDGIDGALPGRPATGSSRRQVAPLVEKCDVARRTLADVDNARTFRDLLDRANRANVSFYPVDPRGLPSIDTSIADTRVSPGGVTQPLLTPADDAPRLTERIGTLRTLAAATDGLAVVDRVDIESGLRRIVDDLTSYYLIGYYSTNTKLDGRFRRLDVRVTRPDVQVRARRGYLAATREELEARPRERKPPEPPAAPQASERIAAALAHADRPSNFRVEVSWLGGWGTPAGRGVRLWGAIEPDPREVRTGGQLAAGATVFVTVSSAQAGLLASRELAMEAGARVTAFDVVLPDVPEGPVALEVRLDLPAGGHLGYRHPSLFDLAALPATPVGTPRLSRAGPTTGRRFQLTADPRFSRTERLRLEVPAIGPVGSAEGVVLDRTAKPMVLPVVCDHRPASAGEPAWVWCDVALSPLAPGDYGLRASVTVDGRPHEVLSAFRIR